MEAVRHLETGDLPHCSLTWGRAQTAGFYSMQQKAKTRILLNWQQQINISPISLVHVPKDTTEVEVGGMCCKVYSKEHMS